MSVLANYEPKMYFRISRNSALFPAVQAIQMVWHPTW